MMVAWRGTFVDELLDVAGAANAYPKTADWPTLSPQAVIGLGPEVVIVNATAEDAAPDRLEAVRRAWANWASVPAVKAGRVHVLTETFLTIPGPRVVQAAAVLAEAIHPELRGATPEGARP
jgi:iron complex transport system substrate-binding protein